MTEREATALYDGLAIELGMPAGWRLKFDSASSRFGCCNYSRRIISLSRKLVALNDEKTVGATIRHEIAHALVGPGHGHNHVWRAMAIKCGDDGRRCYDSKVVNVPTAPWEATCGRCGSVSRRHRAPKPGRLTSCGRCSRTFDRNNLLEYRMTAPPPPPTGVVRTPPTDLKVLEVLRLRATGMGYVAIDARFGIFGKKGWWSWKIVKDNR